MKVLLANSAGFCWGVSRAVDKARSLARKGRVYSDGPLIHNEEMMRQLQSEGISETDDISSIGNAMLLIRAHGIPPERRKRLNESSADITDTTCPDVAKIQGLIRKHARLGYSIIIYGDKGHAEVTGLLGFTEGKGYVVTTQEDIHKLPNLNPACLVSQSTQFPSCYKLIAEEVRKRNPETVILDTICEATKKRQSELVEMAANVDAFVVVGSSNSANTVRLLELAKSLKPALQIQTADQIKPSDFTEFHTVGLTAGASTPDFIIQQVRIKLEDL
jgi:(E)-4-hydroxy-3-methyl-but-2-enyl pyrophosphate reductase